MGSYVVVDTVFSIFGICFMEHSKFIQDKIRRVDKDTKDFKEIVELHKEACDYFETLNQIYAPQLIVKLLSVAAFVCVCGFQISEVCE